MSETGWAAISAAVSLLALGAAVAVYWGQRQQADFALARSLHADLTTGEVAKAREDLGTLVHDPRLIADAELPRVRTSYFALLWCFERVYAGRRTIAAGRRASNRPLVFLDEMIGWQVEYWSKNLADVKDELERRLGVSVSDGDSREAFDRLCAELTARASERRQSSV